MPFGYSLSELIWLFTLNDGYDGNCDSFYFRINLILRILASSLSSSDYQLGLHLTPLYGLMTSRYRRGYAFTPNTERVGLDDLSFY